jgi:hypothetical protein
MAYSIGELLREDLEEALDDEVGRRQVGDVVVERVLLVLGDDLSARDRHRDSSGWSGGPPADAWVRQVGSSAAGTRSVAAEFRPKLSDMRAPTSNGTGPVPPGVHDEWEMAERRCLAKGSMALLDRAARPRGRPSATRAGGDPAAPARRSEGSGRTAKGAGHASYSRRTHSAKPWRSVRTR